MRYFVQIREYKEVDLGETPYGKSMSKVVNEETAKRISVILKAEPTKRKERLEL